MHGSSHQGPTIEQWCQGPTSGSNSATGEWYSVCDAQLRLMGLRMNDVETMEGADLRKIWWHGEMTEGKKKGRKTKKKKRKEKKTR